MNKHGFTTRFVVDKTSDEVFNAINNVRSWWSGEITGDSNRAGAEFTYRYKDVHESRQKLSEFESGRKIVWHVIDANLSFSEDPREWIGTDIIFEIQPKGGKTELHFTHAGLVPTFDCYDACSNGWDVFINGNLRNYIATGEVQPNPFETAST